MKKLLPYLYAAGTFLVPCCAAEPEAPLSSPNTMNITIKVGEKEVAAVLQDNASARDFVARLPLTLVLEDYGDTEKISPLPGKLSTAGVPAVGEPFRGAIAYYAPWGNLCIFRKNFRPSGGLVILGRVDPKDLNVLDVPGKLRVTIDVKR